MNKQYCVFGNPIVHSLSPLMHNHAFEVLRTKIGFLGSYGRYLLKDPTRLYQTFLDLGLCGANITVPFKEEAYLQSDEVLGIAKKIKAVNTWVLRSGRIYGYNTDAPGFYETIKNLECKKVLILGAGGSAKAIAYILQENHKEVYIVNKTSSRLRALENDFSCSVASDLKNYQYDLVVNATAAGLQNMLPFEEEWLKKILVHAKFAYDLMYGDTPFLRLARELKIQNMDGKNMLIMQGALAFELFCGQEIPEVFSIMQEALL
ncbi:shikimate dehydrogenase [Helicobacter anatolicus]|uniref:shikimate dehydrogenase n=1 Tax=Helicobacter anatolicus TaxID=2905874 RepID=UPI001E50C64D|nr:shikimate dehydrogenase [Helicobacter anatolicus]MCE3039614.1 shikimate dehydrogenase [Helicobacter anatolicus]